MSAPAEHSHTPDLNDMLKRISWLALLPVILFSSVLRLAASEVTLKNGDRLSGKIVEETAEAVVIETEYAGKLTIAREHIETIADGSAKTSGPAPVEPAPAQVAATEKKPEPAPAGSFKAPERIFSGGFKGLVGGWEGNANIGFSVTSGNSNNTTMTTGLRAVKNGGPDKLPVYARSVWNSDRGAKNVALLVEAAPG